MARFRCPDCRAEGPFEYDGTMACPSCGSARVQFALTIEELLDVHPNAFDDIDREIAEFETLTRH
ncbi:hydrogenase maturation nickel metallochaperone HypA [Rhodopseudomonas sp. BR0G17]|uniref:hydrogenase maturation nickel metallochaperone HypA n=1 Tax=Rhodopseudomonas sp. BR0G17 TaxID=2269368 RepID=UPI0013DECD19|nr:hydrogenase maturation nickel metallochaperone HypA [Rhodopseudomonas sp. BR0G17]NEW97151.1 hypothetical protein [Rhodopseudomonas sp. BR0G17]